MTASSNTQHKKDIPFLRQLLDKHSQLMRMYRRNGNIELSKEQFDSVKRLFKSLNDEGSIMSFYTVDDFEQDCKYFKE